MKPGLSGGVRHRPALRDSAVLQPSFFDRPAENVARDLLGKALVRRTGRRSEAFIVTETEAYLG